jgi:HK97 gp10 family phage protein
MSRLINITGGRELALALKELPSKIERSIMRKAMRAGARVIANEAKSNVPVQDGDLKRSIRVSTTSKRGQVEAKAVAGNKKAYYANWVEFGTIGHEIAARPGKVLRFKAADGKIVETQRVLHPGARAKPFMRPALDTKADVAVKAVADTVRRNLNERGLNSVGGGSDDS